MAKLRVSYSDRRNGARASVAVELDLDAATLTDPERLQRLIRDQQAYVRLAVLDELQRATAADRPARSHAHTTEPTRPETLAPTRTVLDRGDAWEPPEDLKTLTDGMEEEPEDIPRDGRQLLGWASKQTPDRKGTIMSFGRKHGLKSKIVDWTSDQVLAAYRHARNQQAAR
jgi:hypothetical protein